jgi:N-acetylneuraminate synthase
VEIAADCGADVVKFQTFSTDQVVRRNAPKAPYQERTDGTETSQYEMIKGLELSIETFTALRVRCGELGIEFMSSPFDLPSVYSLKAMGVARIKIASGEITNAPILFAAARTGLPILLSTGMSTLEDVEEALGVLVLGYMDSGVPAGRAEFVSAARSEEGRRLLQKNVTLFHCTTEYPSPYDEVNLLAMDTLRDAFGLPTGLSDHTQGIAVSIAAVARGACVIEKHFTLDRTLPGPDHSASMEPVELKALVTSIRQVEAAMGRPEKTATSAELKNKVIARRSIVADRAIAAGEIIVADMLNSKRPADGLSPLLFWDVVGKRASTAIAADASLTKSMVDGL